MLSSYRITTCKLTRTRAHTQRHGTPVAEAWGPNVGYPCKCQNRPITGPKEAYTAIMVSKEDYFRVQRGLYSLLPYFNKSKGSGEASNLGSQRRPMPRDVLAAFPMLFTTARASGRPSVPSP